LDTVVLALPHAAATMTTAARTPSDLRGLRTLLPLALGTERDRPRSATLSGQLMASAGYSRHRPILVGPPTQKADARSARQDETAVPDCVSRATVPTAVR
jgi:hypothetical protein